MSEAMAFPPPRPKSSESVDMSLADSLTADTATVLEPIDAGARCECGRVDCTGVPYLVVVPALTGQAISLGNFADDFAQELREAGTSFVCASYLRSGWIG